MNQLAPTVHTIIDSVYIDTKGMNHRLVHQALARKIDDLLETDDPRTLISVVRMPKPPSMFFGWFDNWVRFMIVMQEYRS